MIYDNRHRKSFLDETAAPVRAMGLVALEDDVAVVPVLPARDTVH
jgi:hypothetical protein